VIRRAAWVTGLVAGFTVSVIAEAWDVLTHRRRAAGL
jgi:hypothetical protein